MTALHGIDPCWRCGDPAHWAAETDPATGRPKCPLAVRAATLAEHETRLQLYIDRFVENKISTEYKRQLIAEEHALWRGKAPERKAS